MAFWLLINASTGGFGTYLFGMSERIAKQSGDASRGFKDPSLGWIIGFLFVVSFLGLFSVVPLRKVWLQLLFPSCWRDVAFANFYVCLQIMVIDFKLTYPSGTATAHLINSFHTPQGAKLAKYCPFHFSLYALLSFNFSASFWLHLCWIRKQVRMLGKFFSLSFLWSFFQWFFTGGDNCGFSNFPTFGLKAYQYK